MSKFQKWRRASVWFHLLQAWKLAKAGAKWENFADKHGVRYLRCMFHALSKRNDDVLVNSLALCSPSKATPFSMKHPGKAINHSNKHMFLKRFHYFSSWHRNWGQNIRTMNISMISSLKRPSDISFRRDFAAIWQPLSRKCSTTRISSVSFFFAKIMHIRTSIYKPSLLRGHCIHGIKIPAAKESNFSFSYSYISPKRM